MRFVGELLAETGDLTIRRLRRASEWQKRNGGSIERALVQTGALTEEVLTAALSRVSGLPAVTRERLLSAEPAVVESLPAEARRRLRALPFDWCGVRLSVAVSEPDNTVLETGLVAATGYDIELSVVTDPVLDDCLLTWERREAESRGTAPLDETHAERNAFERLGRAILTNAVRLDALELDLGTDAVSGFARTIHARLPPMTRRLDRMLMPQLLDWLRSKGRASGPFQASTFVVESRRLDGTLHRIEVELVVNTAEQLKLRFETDATWNPGAPLESSEDCPHPRAENDLFCSRCGKPIF